MVLRYTCPNPENIGALENGRKLINEFNNLDTYNLRLLYRDVLRAVHTNPVVQSMNDNFYSICSSIDSFVDRLTSNLKSKTTRY